MKIKQAYVSPAVIRFKNRWFKMFNLREYDNPDEPAVFFYNKITDMKPILKHKTECIVVITSSHTTRLEEAAKLLNKKNIKILATAYISEVLTKMNIPHSWPGCGIFVEKVEPVKLGNMIYVYLPNKTRHVFEKYGGEIIKKIKTNYEILIGDGSIPMDMWYNGINKNYYNKSFIGLNLSNCSGGQTSIVDLGLRGIPCITNVVKTLSTIPWNTIDDIEQIIESESKNIGKINSELAEKVYLSMDFEHKWLEIE